MRITRLSARPVHVGFGQAPSKIGRTVDDHDAWAHARKDPGRSAQAIRTVVEQALIDVGLDRPPGDLKDAVAALGIRIRAGHGREQIEGGSSGRINWQKLLRRYVGRAMEVRPCFDRPPRRFPELVGVLPGRRRQSGKPIVMAIIDTSGSMTPALLGTIDAELAGLARQFSVTVVECDAQIRRVYRYRRLESVMGRGKTDLRPPLERSFPRAHRADLAIYFTDGRGPAPAVPPQLPVIWCLAPGGKAPAAWGRVVRMGALPGWGSETCHAASIHSEDGAHPHRRGRR